MARQPPPTDVLALLSPADVADDVLEWTGLPVASFDLAEERDGARWYRICDNDVGSVRLAKHYLKLDGLTKLGQAVSKVRELGNDVAHNEPTPALMDEARRKMAEAALWSAGGRFLVQPLVQDALKELGIGDADQFCDDMIREVRRRLAERCSESRRQGAP